MGNTLVHKTETVFAASVETARAMQLAMAELVESGRDIDLTDTYRVELIEETLSDGSKVQEVRIRKAERVDV
jgi:hypothetical protein